MLEREVRVKIAKAARDLAVSLPVFTEREWSKIIERALKSAGR